MPAETLEKAAPAFSGPGGPGGEDRPRGGDGWPPHGGSPSDGLLGNPERFGLLAFMGTATMLFIGFTSAYMVRRASPDWQRLTAPSILWLNTAALVLSSVAAGRTLQQTAERFAADNEMCEFRTDQRHASGLGGGNDDRPHRVLVPAQELSRKGDRERHSEQTDAAQPIEFAREFECADHVRVQHVQPDEDNHRGRAKIVQPAQKIPEGRFVGDELKRPVGVFS